MSKRKLEVVNMHSKKPRNECFTTLRKIIIRGDDDPHIIVNVPYAYLKIGDRVYKTKSHDKHWISDEKINPDEYVGLTITQYNEVKLYVFDKMILLTEFTNTIRPIQKLIVDLTSNINFQIVTKKYVIANYILNVLANHIVKYGQSISMTYMGMPIVMEIYNIDNGIIGMVDKVNTELDFNDFDDNIVICNKCIEIDSNLVKVKITSCVSCVNSSLFNFPIVLDKKKIDKYVRNAFNDTFADYDGKKYRHNNLEFDFEIRTMNINKQTKYKNIYRIKDDKDLINVKSETTDVIITERSMSANKICFNVIPSGTEKYSASDSILYVNDIIQHVLNNTVKLTTSQTIKYTIPLVNKQVTLSINYISPESNNTIMYNITPNDTIITFDTQSKSKFILVNNENPHSIKKITFKLKKISNNSFFDILLGAMDENDQKTRFFDPIKLEKLIRSVFPNRTALKHRMKIKYNGIDCMAVVKELDFGLVEIPKSKYATYGLITDETEFKFVTSKKDKSYTINTLVDSKLLSNPTDELEKYVGGLTDEIKVVVRNICLSRGKLSEEFKKRNLKPVRGIIFHGDPGTGKTCMARQLGKLLGCEGDRFRLMSGPEIFSKWVGDSEKNIREIFKPAKDAWKKYGTAAPIYMVVIDEMDAMLPARGRSAGNSVRDTVVNQFLAEMDGLEQFHNLIVIGITNLLHLIDPAVLRPGRFGVHIKINLPKRQGRKKIFEIHSKKLIELDRLDKIDFDKLVDQTDGYSGADIEAIIEMASTFSMERLNKLDIVTEETIMTNGKITQLDFDKAMTELRKMKGEDQLKHLYI